MRQLPKHYLYLSSFLLILLASSCKISKYKHANCNKVVLTEQLLQPMIKPQQPLKYKATIDVLKNHLTGLLIVKQTDSVTTHFVFVTELGMKMFDFSYVNNTMNADFVFEPLNKPKLIQSLMRNFENMFLLNAINHPAGECKNKDNYFYVLEKLPREKTTVYLKTDSLTHVQNQEIFNGRKKSSKIDYSYTQTTNTSTSSAYHSVTENYSRISTIQYGLVKIYIDLASIE